MQRKRILVPLGVDTRNLKSVHYALALASRIEAQIYIIREMQSVDDDNTNLLLLNEALRELINNARQNGISLSLHEVDNHFVDEIVKLVDAEHIELLVFSTDNENTERLMTKVKPLVSSQVIQVREKEQINTI